MRRILALPFPTPLSRRLMLLTYRGRQSGKQYRQPLSYVRHDDTLLTPGGGKWTLNLVDGRAEHVRLGGRDVILYPAAGSWTLGHRKWIEPWSALR